MADIVITEFMDEAAIRQSFSGMDVLYDPKCQDGKPLVYVSFKPKVSGQMKALRRIIAKKRYALVTVEGTMRGPEPVKIDKSIRIRIFGPDGSLVKAFGRGGQGPGEFSGPGGINVAPGGAFAVSDVLNGRISYFTREGAHLKDTAFGTYRLAGLVIDGRSNLYVTHVQPPSGDQMVWDLIKLGPDMKLLSKVFSLPMPFKRRVVNLISIRLFFRLAGDDRLAWMASNDYEIRVVDGSGRTVMRISKDGSSRSILPRRLPVHTLPKAPAEQELVCARGIIQPL